MISLVPVGGLCNRMRAIDAGIALQRRIGVPLRVYWESNDGLNCPFHRLFQPIPEIELIEGLPWTSRQLLRFGRFHDPIKVLSWLTGTAYYHHDEHERLVRDAHPQRSLLSTRRLHIISFARFHPTPEKYHSFRPIPELEMRIAEVASQFTTWTIGVHIRRTDNINAITVSSTSKFRDAMEKAVVMEPRTKFYLASDCPDTIKELRDHFGDRIITADIPASRKSEEGIQQAVVELYALSRTSYMFRSHFSSFSRTAAEIGNINSKVIGQTQKESSHDLG